MKPARRAVGSIEAHVTAAAPLPASVGFAAGGNVDAGWDGATFWLEHATRHRSPIAKLDCVRCIRPSESANGREACTSDDELLDVEGAAELLDMTEGALRKAVERGQVPCQRVGSRLRFRRMDLLGGSQRAVPARGRTAAR